MTGKISVEQIKRLIEQIAKERDVRESLVEKALKDAIVTAIKKGKGVRGNLIVEFTEEGIKPYLVEPVEVFLKRKQREGEIVNPDRYTQIEGVVLSFSPKGGLKVKTDRGTFVFKDIPEGVSYESGDRIRLVLIPLEITPEEVDYYAAKAAKETFLKELNQAIKEQTYREFKELEGDIVYGLVRKVLPSGDLVVDLGKIEAIFPKKEQIPTETYNVNDRIKALLWKVEKRRGKPHLVLSRTHPLFLRRLLEREIGEIEEGKIEIKKVVREPGERAKVLVLSRDSKVDPVGVILGVKGERIQPVSKELSGEKIDIVRYSEKPEELIKNAMVPAKAIKVILKPTEKRAEVVVPDNQLSLAIGKKGSNVKLVHRLTGYHIDVFSESDYRKIENLSKGEGENQSPSGG
ncbi:MAG TPA: transcription termination factor NusA [Aquificales bacterium]|nr:transcription termination factor NusA [Aquificales bacterium]